MIVQSVILWSSLIKATIITLATSTGFKAGDAYIWQDRRVRARLRRLCSTWKDSTTFSWRTISQVLKRSDVSSRHRAECVQDPTKPGGAREAEWKVVRGFHEAIERSLLSQALGDSPTIQVLQANSTTWRISGNVFVRVAFHSPIP